MQIQSGKLYKNRTWKYIYPCLKYYGPELNKHLGTFFKLGVGINDYNMDIKGERNHIFILVDTNLPFSSEDQIKEYKLKFSKFLDWLTYQHYYVADYVYEDFTGKHMIVLQLPYKHDASFLSFVQGKYSDMYGTKEINDYFKFVTLTDKAIEKTRNDEIREVRMVLTKDKKYLGKFTDMVNTEFKTKLKPDDFADAEFDFPPVLKEEIFNY